MEQPEIDWQPSLHQVWLPSRAFLQSWLDQTVPARRAAIEEAVELHEEALRNGDPTLADMALLGVVADAMQALEDLAYLGIAWDSPFDGIAQYVRATTYTPTTAQTFWQEIRRKWDDRQFEVFAGLSLRSPEDGGAVRTTDLPGPSTSWTPEDRTLFDDVAAATVAKLRRLLRELSDDWLLFQAYFQSFKHGGLAINRQDTYFVDDDVEHVDKQTPRHHPSIGVWTRGGRKQELMADFASTPEQVVKMAAGAGRIALDMVEVFVEMRLWVFDAISIAPDGTILGWRSVQIPFTAWLVEKDLPDATWKRIGYGPWLRMEADDQPAGDGQPEHI